MPVERLASRALEEQAVFPPFVIHISDDLRIRVGTLKEQAARRLAVEGYLKRVVMRVQVALERVNIRSPVEGREERLARDSGIDRRRVQFLAVELMDQVVSDIGDAQEDIAWQRSLRREVPGFHVTAMELARRQSSNGGVQIRLDGAR